MLKVYKKLLYYVPKEKWLAYLAILVTTVSTVLTTGTRFVSAPARRCSLCLLHQDRYRINVMQAAY